MAEALYRKYRPQNFSEVVGQEHIVQALKGALEAKKTTHTYLFAGPRGTGKTSVARILARALGCEAVDLVEIDAASNTGVDDVRELQEGVRTLPFASPVKVYIIDEVHMLSKNAFNALLKTLEEPPTHAVFILATTDVHKVPETVLSRCEVHTFKPPSLDILTKTALAISQKEGYTLTPDSARLLAFLGDGSFRDMIGILQKVINASTDKKISAEEVLAITGAPRRQAIESLVSAMVERNLPAVLEQLNQAERDNLDAKILIKILMGELRLIMLALFAPDLKKGLKAEIPADNWEFIGRMVQRPGARGLPAVLRELLIAYGDLDYAAVPELPLELAVIKALGPVGGEET